MKRQSVVAVELVGALLFLPLLLSGDTVISAGKEKDESSSTTTTTGSLINLQGWLKNAGVYCPKLTITTFKSMTTVGEDSSSSTVVPSSPPTYHFETATEEFRGVIATSPIQKGEIVTAVPFSIGFSEDKMDADLKRIVDLYYFSPTHKFGLFLLYERLHKKENSFWHSYFQILPKSFHTTLYWDDNELLELQRSYLRQFTAKRKSLVQTSYSQIFTETLFVDHPALFPQHLFTLEMWQWALSIIWSRVISSPSGPALIPLADLFNMQPLGVTPSVTVVSNSSHLNYIASRNIGEGEEILISYGSFSTLSNGQLLMDYGFALTDNPNDVLIFLFSITEDDDFWEKKRELFDELKFGEMFYVNKDEFPVDLIVALRIYHMTEDELQSSLHLSNALAKRIISPSNEKATFTTLLSFCSKLYHSYASTIEEDQALLEGLKTTPFRDNLVTIRRRRKRHAVILRLGEKSILLLLINRLSYFLKQMDENEKVDLK